MVLGQLISLSDIPLFQGHRNRKQSNSKEVYSVVIEGCRNTFKSENQNKYSKTYYRTDISQSINIHYTILPRTIIANIHHDKLQCPAIETRKKHENQIILQKKKRKTDHRQQLNDATWSIRTKKHPPPKSERPQERYLFCALSKTISFLNHKPTERGKAAKNAFV